MYKGRAFDISKHQHQLNLVGYYCTLLLLLHYEIRITPRYTLHWPNSDSLLEILSLIYFMNYYCTDDNDEKLR